MVDCLRKYGTGCAIQKSADSLLNNYRAIPGNEDASMAEAVNGTKKAKSGNPTMDEMKKDLRGLNGCANCIFQGFKTVLE